MLGVDGRRNIVGYDSTPPAGAHDRDEYIAWMNSVAKQIFILFFANVAAFCPLELVIDGVINAQDSNPAVNEFSMQELTAKWTGAYGALIGAGDLRDRQRPP